MIVHLHERKTSTTLRLPYPVGKHFQLMPRFPSGFLRANPCSVLCNYVHSVTSDSPFSALFLVLQFFHEEHLYVCLCIGFVTHAFVGMYLKFRGSDQCRYLMCSSFSTHLQVSNRGMYICICGSQATKSPPWSQHHPPPPCILVPQDKTGAGRREKGLSLFFVTFLCS